MTMSKKGACPKCRQRIDYEPCEVLPKAVPLCDSCERRQADSWAAGERRRIWRNLYAARMPSGYAAAKPLEVRPWLRQALEWDGRAHRGGIGLIGPSGSGKSCAVACLIYRLELSFTWWSGTEAREAAVAAATATATEKKDRDGAGRTWERAMRVPMLVLDDISQGRMTEAWSARLFDLLEERSRSVLPTIWTSQINLTDFREKIVRQNGGDREQASAISRRLGQNALILKNENCI
jgi:DNA replication protein DnaC